MMFSHPGTLDGASEYARICRLAIQAHKRMLARKDEDVDEWAKTLAADLVAAGDIETEAMAKYTRHPIARAEPYIRGHELPMNIVTFDGLTLPYGELGL